jgi:hypothetical protein
MATFSARPTLSTMKRTVLKTIQGLVSKTLYRSIEILFQPCCDVTITNVQVDCSSVTPGNYDITITLDKSINMLGNGLLFVLVDGVTVTVDGNEGLTPYNDSNKIVLLDSNIGNSSGGFKSVVVFFLLPGVPLNNIQGISQLTPGVFTLAANDDTDWDFPNCEL